MRFTMKGMLVTGILAVSCTSALVAQPSNDFAEQWYRAKFGHPSTTEHARLNQTKQVAVRPAQTSAVTPARHANVWLEQFYHAKHGRPTPREEARLQEANLGRAAVMTSSAVPVNTQFESWYRAKYGRTAPVE